MKRQEPLIEAAESSFRAAGISDCFCREVRYRKADDKRAGRRYFGGDCMKRQEPLIEAAESSFRAAGISDCFCREVRWEHVELSEVNFFKTSLRKMIAILEVTV